MTQLVRSLVKTPAFTVVAVVTIALGIGANTAIFSVVNGVLLRPLPYPQAERIVQVWTTSVDDPDGAHSAPDFLAMQRGARTVEALAGYRMDALTLVPAGADPARIEGALVTANYFDVFGRAAALGRTFSGSTDTAAPEPLVVLGHETWRTTLAGDPAVVGRLLRINGVPHTVIGVMPEGFDYPLGARAWVLSPKPVPLPPLDIEGDLLETRGVHYFMAVGRLRTGVTIEQAQADFTVLAEGLATQYPRTNAGRGARVEALHEQVVGDVRQALLVLLAAVGVVLLIACANVASLLLARASGRQRELAIRAALGASRGRLMRQLLGESLMLAAAGGALGLLLGTWALELLVAAIPPGVPRTGEIGLDGRVAAVCFALALGSAVLFGLLPSLQAARTDASGVLRESGDRATTAGRQRARMRAVLVVAEIALTLVLLVSAALLAGSFIRLQRTDPGFAADQVILVEMPLPQAKYTDGAKQAAFYGRLLEGLKGRGEIEMAAVAFPSPLGGADAAGTFYLEGRPAPTRAEQPRAALAAVSPDYFRTTGITLVSGRPFTDRDVAPAPAPLIINAAFARRHFPGVDALGKRLRFDEGEPWMTIVGVAADSRSRSIQEEPAPLMYLPYQYFTLPFMSIVARSPGGAAAVSSAVRSEVRAIDPDIPIDRVRPLREVVNESVAEPKFRAVLLAAFAGVAVLLAAVGLYGLISYSVSQRTREIGIRVALGATSAQVIAPIMREGMILAAVGVALGLAGALGATWILGSLLFGIEATDPLTFGGVASLMLGVALFASYVPSRRALRVDPLTALRAD